MNAIYILWLRQLKRYSRSPARIIGALGQPLMFLVAFGFGFNSIFERAGEGNYIQFLVPGMVAVGIIFTAIFSGIEIIWDRQFGFLKETLVAPVSRFQIMIGRTFGGATVAVLQGTIVFFISLIVGFRPVSIAMLPVAFLIMILIAIVFASLGTCFGCLLKDFQGFPLIMNFVIMPLFFLSGALFPIRGLPTPLYDFARLNPLAYGVDGLHTTLSSISDFSLTQDFLVLTSVSLALIFLGSYLFSRMET